MTVTRLLESLAPHLDVIAPLAAFVAISAAFWMVARRLQCPAKLQRRLAPDRVDDPEEAQGLFGDMTPALAAQLPESEKETRGFTTLLRGAGIYSPQAIKSIYALRFVLLFVPMVAAGTLAVVGPAEQTFKIVMIGIVVGAGLSIIPRLYVFFRRRSRHAQIVRGLPDTMDMLAMCMDGGIGLSASLAHVAGRLENCPALAQELKILRRQAEVSSLKQALADFGRRVDVPEARSLGSLLMRGDRLGTQLSGSLLEQSDHLRTQRRQLATIQANKTPVKLVLPLMFCFAPAALILLISPAVLELKEFLAPSSGRSVLIDGDGLDTRSSIFTTLDRLDQDIDL